MKKKYQNGFFIFGLVLLGIMLTQLDYAEVWRGLQHTGYWHCGWHYMCLTLLHGTSLSKQDRNKTQRKTAITTSQLIFGGYTKLLSRDLH